MALLPPRVKAPLSECSTRVRVEGQLTGSTISVYADGALVAQDTAGSSSHVLLLTTPLNRGQSVTATQTIGVETSPATPDGVIVQSRPLTIGPVSFATHLHVCGECVWVNGVIPGALVEVFGNGGLRGQGEGFDGIARFGLNSPRISSMSDGKRSRRPSLGRAC